MKLKKMNRENRIRELTKSTLIFPDEAPGNVVLFASRDPFSSSCLRLCPGTRTCAGAPRSSPSHTRHLAGRYICAGLVCSDFCFFVCLLGAGLFVVFWGKSHIALKFIERCCLKCQVVTGMVCCLGVPLLEMALILRGAAGFPRASDLAGRRRSHCRQLRCLA